MSTKLERALAEEAAAYVAKIIKQTGKADQTPTDADNQALSATRKLARENSPLYDHNRHLALLQGRK